MDLYIGKLIDYLNVIMNQMAPDAIMISIQLESTRIDSIEFPGTTQLKMIWMSSNWKSEIKCWWIIYHWNYFENQIETTQAFDFWLFYDT